jgi:hypothetical protein
MLLRRDAFFLGDGRKARCDHECALKLLTSYCKSYHPEHCSQESDECVGIAKKGDVAKRI